MSVTSIKEERIAAEAFLRERPNVDKFALIGSAMYLPAEQVGDVDFAVLLKPGNDASLVCVELGRDYGFEPCGDYDADAGRWFAMRRDNLNLMVTHDPQWYADYLLAMEVCKVLRLQHKDDRIAVCRVVRDKLAADVVRPFADGVFA